MHFLTVVFLNEEKVALAVPVTSVGVKVTGSKAMFALNFSTSFLSVSDEKTKNVSTKVCGVQNVNLMYD